MCREKVNGARPLIPECMIVAILEPKFKIGENVSILGSKDLKCIVQEINEEEQFNYTYVLKVCNHQQLEKIDWIPECVIVKK